MSLSTSAARRHRDGQTDAGGGGMYFCLTSNLGKCYELMSANVFCLSTVGLQAVCTGTSGHHEKHECHQDL